MRFKPVLLLIAFGFLVYFNSLFNSFVWDDEEQIINNTLIHKITNISLFYTGSTFNTGGSGEMGGLYYKPFMTTVYSLIYAVSGANAFSFHFFQVSLHIINAILVFYIFKFFLKKEIIALVLSLIFLIHPINTESVVYIAALQEPLFFFFGSLAFVFILQNRKGFIWSLLTGAVLLFSYLSKETGLVFLPIIFAYLIIFKKTKISFIVSTVVSLAVYVLLRFAVAGIYFNKHGLTSISNMDILGRLMNIPQIIFFYLKTFIFPKDLLIDQQWTVSKISLSEFYLPLLGIFTVLAICIFLGLRLRKKHSSNFLTYFFFSIWFSVALGFHLQIFPLDLTVAERWFYLPIIGLLGMLGVISLNFRLLPAVILIIIIALSVRTMVRNSDWQNGLTLYGHDIKISRPNFDLENNFGVELFRSGNYSEAKIHFENSVELKPNWWTNWNNLGVVLEKEGNFENAKNAYKKALDKNSGYYLANENLARLLSFRGKPEEAKIQIEKSLQILPQNPKLWLYLSIAEYKMSNLDSAKKDIAAAYFFDPANPEISHVYQTLQQNQPLKFE